MMRRVTIVLMALMVPATGMLRAQPREAKGVYDQALELLADGRLDEGIALLEQARTAGTATPRALALLGALLVRSGRTAEAFAVLQPLADGADPDPGVLYNAGRAALALGRTTLGEGYLQRSLELSPGSPAARELGLLRGRQGRYREAFALLVPWARQEPADIEVRLAAALSAIVLERAPTAEELLSDLPQDRPQVRLLWGRLLLLQGDPWGAIATLKPLLEGPSTELRRDARRSLAEGYIMTGSSAAAVEVLEGHVAGDAAAALQLSQAQYLSGDLEGALRTLAPLVELAAGPAGAETRPRSQQLTARMVLHYGRLLSAAERHDEALPYLEQAVGLRPEEAPAWQAYGQALAAAGRGEEAREALERFRQLADGQERPSAADLEQQLRDPTGSEIARGMLLLESGEAQQALEVARSERELAPDDPRPGLLEGRALLELERPEEALDAAQRLIARFPESGDALYLRGVVRMAFRDLEQAEADLRGALELAPDHTAAMNDLAVLLMDRGVEDEARALLERALELYPDDPIAAANLQRLER